MTKRIPVVGAAIIENGKLLAAKRTEGRSLGGYWEFPGGKIDSGETPEEALKREVFEEFGANATIFEKIDEPFEKEYDFGVVVLEILYVRLDSEITKTIEHEELRWVSEQEALELSWAPTDVPAIKELVERGFN
ncbi:(deoxy)nucleoside triphosphate pyrophosphohydrolase [Weissella cibaria]|uniref:8-oxo-dGTP diphosphatase n=1 Tax=Weissella cibaria TaxID=137591 RepID=A0A9Q8JGU3_9LACO|nr:(deoxy)nucleoside triphosphate pyrophosphohydrolase [Weissella cibaria]MCS8561315.1 (deoxy)nucleoside triphosphate pyrophosphohydrolase [Weissella cibaria]MCS8566038.1 (deoxy)nucleoside triphosphate pyrophosphohydrolase [Weissella cibaria]MCS8576944.1 (deoxy)nucleoside triphosphate pyrophosphohydrolase [Weissella cibaria]MYV35915.1 NUDIX domain-containing protein [Weissella cibaria]TVV26896.1 (deoxy)nucleoside triphosphate pyrophosphohydrolase [Weissella cibaria]